MSPTLSVVLPVYNESETLEALFARLLPALEGSTQGSFEVLFINDGSSDGSDVILDAFHARDARVKVIHFSRNFGHQAALQAGLDAARGKAVVLMDADLQDPPEMVGAFVDRWRQGDEVVYAVRTERKDGFLKRTTAAIFYRTLQAISEVQVPLDAGDFCLLDRRVVDALVGLSERNRYLRGLRSWVGFRQAAVPYARDARYAGVGKYGLRKMMRLAVSGYIGFSTLPLQLATWLGFLAAMAGFGMIVWVILCKLLDIPTVSGWASTLAAILFVGGAQLLMLGVVGEYLGRVYDEVRRRPLYIVRTRVGLDGGAGEDALQ
jgi:glycosyltransferase involved in cell wall biosynthesis